MRVTADEEHYCVIDDNCHMNKYDKKDIEDLNALCVFLIDEYCKQTDKQKQWFEKYWDLKKKLNKIIDMVEE